MFNRENDINHFQQKILMTKLNICAEESHYFENDLPYISVCIKTFVATLSDYDNWYVSNFNEAELKDLISLIQDPAVLFFLLNQQLKLHWIFGSRLSLKDEHPAICARMLQYNAPWGKEITQKLATMLANTALKRFLTNGTLRFEDLRTWDKTNEMGIAFVYEVLAFLINHAQTIHHLLDQKYLTTVSLHQYFLTHSDTGFDDLIIYNNNSKQSF